MNNEFTLKLPAITQNEAFARSTVAAFCVELNPSLEQINDIKTAVSEAVTNCIVHAYRGRSDGQIEMRVCLENGGVAILIRDEGCGIAVVEQAMQPFYTSMPEQERSGMGFTLMRTFMDDVQVESDPAKGTTVRMRKQIRTED